LLCGRDLHNGSHAHHSKVNVDILVQK